MNTKVYFKSKWHLLLLSVLLVALFFTKTTAGASISSTEWVRTYGSEIQEFGEDIIPTFDGGYIISGIIAPITGDADFLVVKIDKNGNHEWNATYGGEKDDYPESILQTADKGYILVGSSIYMDIYSNIFVVKITESGYHEWNKTFTYGMTDCAYSIVQAPDDGYLISGSTRPYSAKPSWIWLMNIDSSGNEQWNKTYYGSEGGTVSLVPTAEGGYSIASQASTPVNVYDFYFQCIKIDENGNVLWNKSYPMSGHNTIAAHVQTADQGFILIGTANVTDILLVKVDSNGDLEWVKTFDGGPSNAGVQTLDDGYVIGGRKYSSDSGGCHLG